MTLNAMFCDLLYNSFQLLTITHISGMNPDESDDERNDYWIEPDAINERIFITNKGALPDLVKMRTPASAVAVAKKLSAAAKGPAPVKKYKKAPDAPRRFKSAFIFFSIEKHREIRESLASGGEVEKVRFALLQVAMSATPYRY